MISRTLSAIEKSILKDVVAFWERHNKKVM